MRTGPQGPRNGAGGAAGGGAPAPAPASPGLAPNASPSSFGSPSVHPNAFRGHLTHYLSGLVGQLGQPAQRGRVTLPDFGPQPGGGGKPRVEIGDSISTPDPNAGNQGGAVGPQGFGTYAPGVEDSQFTRENFQRQAFKGREGNVTQLDASGGLGGFGGMGYGSMGGMGMMGMGGGVDPAMLQMIQALLGQFGGGRGTLVGR